MDILKIRAQFKENLKPSGWDRVLNEFIDSSDFETLMIELKNARDTTGITPDSHDVFRAFYECPYNELKVVMMGQDPYPEEGVADGVAFSSRKKGEVTTSLKVIFREIHDSYYAVRGEDWYSWDPDLTRWSKQGILLINTALTTVPDKIGEHYNMWKPFMSYLFKKLVDMNTGLIYVFMGHSAKDWAKSIPESNYKFYCYHPNSASHNDGEWESNDIFNRINELVEGSNGIKIIW